MPRSSPIVSRRAFLSAAGAVAAAPMILSRRAGAVPANDRIAVGFIGMGIRGRELLQWGWLASPDIQVIAVCDVDTTRREHRKTIVDKHYGNADCAAYVDYREMLTRDDLDAVVIATPDHWHTHQVLDACRAGKDIYCEKPLTITLREAQMMIEAVRAHDRVFQTGSQQRTEFGHRFVQATEHVRNGRIGEIISINVGVGVVPQPCDLPEEEMEPGLDWDRWLGPAPLRPYHSELSPRGVHDHYPRWRQYREYAGGYLADMGAHHFDIAHWGLKMDQSGPVRVVPPAKEDAQYGAMVIYENGVKLIHGGPSGTTFIGREGMIHVDRDRTQSVPEDLLDKPLDGGGGDERLPRWDNHLANFVKCVRDRTRPICDVEVGARSVAVCHLLNLAYQHRRELRWDPQAWRFIGDAEANRWLDYDRRAGYEHSGNGQ